MNSTTACIQALPNPGGQTSDALSRRHLRDPFRGIPSSYPPQSASAATATDARSSLPTPRAGLIRTITVPGPAGGLEAVLNLGSHDAPYAALVCHPHPMGGGNLHNKVVYHTMKALNSPKWGFGWPVLRFNFRGTGLSEGSHDGQAESEDVLAAMDWLSREYRLPLVVAGFSFGAAMVLRACSSPRPSQHAVRALIALGLPMQAQGPVYRYPFLAGLAIPKLFLSGDHDQFAPADQLIQVATSAAEPKRLIFIPGADHFFSGQLEPMQRALAAWLKEQML